MCLLGVAACSCCRKVVRDIGLKRVWTNDMQGEDIAQAVVWALSAPDHMEVRVGLCVDSRIVLKDSCQRAPLLVRITRNSDTL